MHLEQVQARSAAARPKPFGGKAQAESTHRLQDQCSPERYGADTWLPTMLFGNGRIKVHQQTELLRVLHIAFQFGLSQGNGRSARPPGQMHQSSVSLALLYTALSQKLFIYAKRAVVFVRPLLGLHVRLQRVVTAHNWILTLPVFPLRRSCVGLCQFGVAL